MVFHLDVTRMPHAGVTRQMTPEQVRGNTYVSSPAILKLDITHASVASVQNKALKL